jgi:hypothetical protein
MQNHYFYSQDDGLLYYITETGNELYTLPKQDKALDSNIRWFECFSGDRYSPSLEGLIVFREDFNRWADELLTQNIDYKKAFNNELAVMRTFTKYSKREVESREWHTIGFDEYVFMEGCFNAGLMYFNSEFKNVPREYFGYDCSRFYPNILGNPDLNFEIPCKKGVFRKYNSIVELKSVDGELPYGIYKVKITSTNPNAVKVFSFSKDGYYTHYSLRFAFAFTRLDFQFELDTTEEYNALIYENVIPSHEIFGNWLKSMKKLKAKFPENKLAKYLASSLHGHLVKFKRARFVSEEESDEIDMTEPKDKRNSEFKIIKYVNRKYTLIKTDNPYERELARLKPFLVSYGREFMGRLLISRKLVDKVVRIHTDGFSLTEAHDFTKMKTLNNCKLHGYGPSFDVKSTGHILMHHLNHYHHLDSKKHCRFCEGQSVLSNAFSISPTPSSTS